MSILWKTSCLVPEEGLGEWSGRTRAILNVARSKEMVIDFRKGQRNGGGLQGPGFPHQQETELEDQHRGRIPEEDEQTLLPEEVEILQHVQQDVGYLY